MHNFAMKECSVILEPVTPKVQTSLTSELHSAIEERNLLTTRTKAKVLKDLKDLHHDTCEADRARRRARAVEELINTEYSYLCQLKTVEDFFMNPVKEQNLLTPLNYHTLFSNLNVIRRLNEALLVNLRKSNNVGDVFIQMAPFLNMYSTYAFYYKRGLDILLEAGLTRTPFFKFMQQQESRPEVQQKLSALLITPIQRIPRYCLILQKILDNTSKSDPSFKALTESLESIQKVVENLDGLVGCQEDAQRFAELQSYLKNGYPVIIKPGRKLIKEGILNKFSEEDKKYHKRYFLLMSDIIVYCKILKNRINSPNSLKCKGIIPLSKCIVHKISNEVFNVKCENALLSLTHKSLDECKQWLEAIEATIKICVEHKRTLRKDSSSRRPAFGKSISEYQEVGVSPGVPRKKRRLLDFDDGVHHFAPTIPMKRKSIRDESIAKIKLPEYINAHAQDSLYPLRKHLTEKHVTFAENVELPPTTSLENTNDSGLHPDIYIFGNDNENKGFQFKIGNMFNVLGKSLKRLFWFKNK